MAATVETGYAVVVIFAVIFGTATENQAASTLKT